MNLIVRSYTVALTPWEVAAGLIWNLPTHVYALGVFGPQSRGTGPPHTHTLNWGHFNVGGVYFSFTFLLINGDEMSGPSPTHTHLSVLQDTPTLPVSLLLSYL